MDPKGTALYYHTCIYLGFSKLHCISVPEDLLQTMMKHSIMWLSSGTLLFEERGRVLDLRPVKSRSLSKTLYPLLSTGLTKEDR